MVKKIKYTFCNLHFCLNGQSLKHNEFIDLKTLLGPQSYK